MKALHANNKKPSPRIVLDKKSLIRIRLGSSIEEPTLADLQHVYMTLCSFQ